MDDLSIRLKNLRQSLGLNQADVARALGMKGAAISKYETGRSIPDAETLKKIANYFNVSSDYLLGISGEPNLKDLSDPLIQRITSLPDNAKERLIGYLDGLDY